MAESLSTTSTTGTAMAAPTLADIERALEGVKKFMPPPIKQNKLVKPGHLYAGRNLFSGEIEYFCHPDDYDSIIANRSWIGLREKMEAAGA